MNADENLLHGCLSAGLNLPYFCWHPALGSVGACRQCAVKQFKDEHDQHGRIVMACMTPAAEGTRIAIRDPEAVAFRAAIIEGLMLNHPHDCPVCDEGGECHLQDMTVMTGHDYRRYEFDKRTFRNQDLGPLVNHEMNRCIQCYRCVRYYRDYAGGRDLNAFALRNTVFFGRHEDGVLENAFSGNLVEICPTGVFTDKTLKRHYTRKWDQQFAPSICVHCGLGCNTTVGERYGTVRRIVNRYHHDVNGYFLCDRGRFGYEFVNSHHRIREPLLKGKGVSAETARRHLHERLASGKAIGIGSPRASLESNFALRTLVGAGRTYDRYSATRLLADTHAA
jgi:NADH-quinone oxidoreductase subunit G